MPPLKPHVASLPDHMPSSLLSLLTGWMQQGIENFSATQRVFEEVAVRQNTAAAQSLQKPMAGAEHSSVAILTELAVRGTSSFIEAQKILLHLAQREGDIAMKGIKERVGDSRGGETVTNLVRRTLDTFLRMQQDFLQTTNRQITRWLESLPDPSDHPGAPLVERAREAMETFVHAQKQFLDVIAEEASRMSSGQHPPKTRTKKTDLTRLAEEATRSFVTAQQRLLEVVSRQMDVSVKATTQAMNLLSPSCILPMSNISGESIGNFIGAEKTLIDAMMKPGRNAKVKGANSRKPVRRQPEGVQAGA